MQGRLSSGVTGLDGLLGGGLPRGRTTLISGKSGTGKSSLATQVACGCAAAGLHVVYASVDEAPEDVLEAGDALGACGSALQARGALTVLDARLPLEGQAELTGEADLGGLLARLDAEVRRTGAQVVVVDSVSSLFHPPPRPEAVRQHVLSLVRALEDRGLTVVLTSDAPADYSRPTPVGAEDVAALVLVLRNTVDGTRRRRTLEVYKYRRSEHRKGEYPFTISRLGVNIFPVDMPQEAPERRASSERYPSGLEGLDTMTSGGWLRDSIVLVRGPAGSGKTTLAGMYLRAGAQRGERVAYYGFEEPRHVLLRNFASLGMPLEEPEAGGLLQLACRYPEATSPEDILVEMRRDLEARAPSLIVVDSISSIEHSTSPGGFRLFLIGLASLLRQFGGSAVLTQTISPNNEGGQHAPYLSTVADAILSLDYSADAPRLTRTMRVLKMRGSAHSSDQWRLRIQSDGLHVEPLPAG